METKTYILDTNVLLSDPSALFSFKEHDLVIPMIVLEELDRHKDRQDEVGRNARETSRKLTEITKEHKAFKDPVPLGEGLGKLYIMSISSLGFKDVKELLPSELEGKSGDNQILALCLALKNKSKQETVLISRDILLRLKANALGIVSDDYKKLHVAKSAAGLYSGSAEVVGDFDINAFFEEGKLELPEELVKEYHENQYLNVTNPTTNQHALMRLKGNFGHKITEFAPCKINGKNVGQRCAIDALLDPQLPLVTVVGQAGTGKAQPLHSKVLTPTGWTTMGSLTPGDRVIGRNGKPTTVVSVHPQGKKPIYRVVFSDNTSTECCDDHLWNVKTENDRGQNKGWRTLPLSEVRGFLARNKKRQLSIPMVEPVEFEKQEIPLDPYVLGVLLGDGSMTANFVRLTSADDELVEAVAQRLPNTCKIQKRKNTKYDYSISRKQRNNQKNDVVAALESLGLMGSLSYDKFVPDVYKFNSVETRLSLLKGLMDTDGTVSKDGTSTVFYSTSRVLAEDVKELVESFGGKAVIANKQTRYTHKGEIRDGHPSYAVHISMPPSIIPFSLKRKLDRFKPRTKYVPARFIDRVEYVGEVEAQCIYVEDAEHLYLTDNYIVTHNTLLAIAAGLHQVLERKQYKSLIVCRPIQPLGKDIGFLPGTMEEKMEPWVAPIKDNLRYLISADGKKSKRGEETLQMLFENGTIEVEAMTFIRGRSIANAYIIIDEAQNLNAHELKTIITRVGEGTKIVLTGDIEQIDNMYVDSVSNGLTIAIEKFKSYSISGHVTLTKGERSALATLAAAIL